MASVRMRMIDSWSQFSMRILFTADVSPERIRTRLLGMPRIIEMRVITSRFALPSLAGACTAHPTAFLHSL